MKLAIDLGTVLIEVLIAWYFFLGSLGNRKRILYKEFWYYALYGAVLAAGTIWMPIIPARIFLLSGISLLGNRFAYRVDTAKNFYAVVFYYISVIISDVLAGGIVFLAGIQLQLNMNSTPQIIYNSLAHLIDLFLLQCALHFLKWRENRRDVLWRALPLLLCLLASAYICYQNFFILLDTQAAAAITVETLCLVFINCIICFFVEVLSRFYSESESAKIAEQKLLEQQKYYRDIVSRQEETRALWHDIKKYVFAMEALASERKNDQMNRLYEEVQTKLLRLEQVVDVDNPVLNSILAYALQTAEAKDTKLFLDVWVDQELAIPPEDLYVIIGNTVDNAVQACSELPPELRKVNLALWQMNHLLYYEISNPYRKNTSSKQDGIHGYGLKSAGKCVKKHNGTIEIQSSNESFTVIIQLTIPSSGNTSYTLK